MDVPQLVALLARSRYPLVQLLSWEELRAERLIERAAQQLGAPLWSWSLSDGLLGPPGPQPQTTAPEAALVRLLQHKEPGLFLLRDLHPHVGAPGVVRLLRDLARVAGGRRQLVVLLGPVPLQPTELAKDLVTIDLPLPDADEVQRLLSQLLKHQDRPLAPEQAARFVRGALGLTEEEIKRLFARVLLGGGRFGDEDLRTLIEEKRRIIRHSRYLELWEGGLGVGDVGGMDNLKRWLEQRAAGFTPAARAFGLPEPRGVFLLGVQGCGKSLMAKAVADLWRLPLLRLDVAAVFGGGAVVEGQSLRETIKIAESLAPAVLWIDEIEKGFARDSSGGEAFGTFLTWMQEKQKPVFVVSTANDVRHLPPELLRKGRFDEIFFVDLPGVHERLAVLEIHLRRRGRDPMAFDLVRVAEETERFSGAELEQLVVSALFAAYAEGSAMRTEHLLDCLRETIPLAVTMDDHLKALREWARPRARPASQDRRRADWFEAWEEITAP
ncbi:MAG: AAA family ATPase [Deltaproteobacteria bacterium]|nr:AAA family ATPase [Deltaproteobacteria bacterium]